MIIFPPLAEIRDFSRNINLSNTLRERSSITSMQCGRWGVGGLTKNADAADAFREWGVSGQN